MQHGWIGVDLDGTLAHYDHWRGIEHIGDPVPAMVKRIHEWRDRGIRVKIFTARVSHSEDAELARHYVEKWCLKHLGVVLPVTNVKDFGTIELWDDRAIQVIPNTGTPVMR